MRIPFLIAYIIATGLSADAENIHITGRVTDTHGAPLAGVFVRLMKNGDTTLTNDSGTFEITGITGINPLTVSKHVSSVTFSRATGILSFAIQTDNTPSHIDIFTIDGRNVGCVLHTNLDKGTYRVKTFSSPGHALSRAVYFIRFRCGKSVYVFKALRLNPPGNRVVSQAKAPPADREQQVAVDTLLFTKEGWRISRVPIDTYTTDIGTITAEAIPLCNISAPSDSAEFHFGDTLSITADVSHPDGDIIAVLFFVDSTLFHTDSTPPYTCTWNTLRHTIGAIPITARAIDTNGKTASDGVTISVSLKDERQYTYRVINKYAHDSMAYTQGLVYENGFFYEGTGIHGRSTLRKVEIETGTALKSISLADEYFGEGIVIWDDRIIQLTWQEHVVFIWDKETFARIDSTVNPHDGWGITHDGSRLILSDGSSWLFFRDPVTFQQLDSVRVRDQDSFVPKLNELEYFYHKVFANVYSNDFIVMIDVASGMVLGRIDCEGLINSHDIHRAGVLNGIAYDPDNDRIYLTGKDWPNIFEVELVVK